MGRSSAAATAAEASVLREIRRLDNLLSAYDAGSEFSRWTTTFAQPVPVSADLFRVLQLFDRWRANSDGALDAAAATIGQVWKTAAARQRLPSQAELDSAVALVQQPHWKLDTGTQTATHLSHAPLVINSFVKTYIIQHAAAAALASPGIGAVVVNIGGDIVIEGDRTETVSIRDPRADAENDAVTDELLLNNKTIATSGNYRRGEMINGRWYSHIVNPLTGQPADNIISATVVAPQATDAGALATAFNVLDPEGIRRLATIPGVEYLVITRDGRQICSKGWASLETPAGKHRRLSALAPRPADNNFELTVQIEIATRRRQMAKRPYVAVWIEDQNHNAVRTIALWHEKDKYLRELKTWFLKYRGLYATDKNALTSVSSATRSPGRYTIKWDGKDDKGQPVPAGSFVLKIEVSREHGSYQLLQQEFSHNETPQSFNFAGNAEISAASFEYSRKVPGGK